MNKEQIGMLIAIYRKEKHLTQGELAHKLNVPNSYVAKWECGVCLPDVSLCKKLCDILGVSLNDFFKDDKIKKLEFKYMADDLMNVLENSVNNLKEKIIFFSQKWQYEHFWEMFVTTVIILFFIIYSFIKNNGYQFLFIFIGFVFTLIERKRMMLYIEKFAYGKESKLSLESIRKNIMDLNDLKDLLKKFNSRGQAIKYLTRKTKYPKENCRDMYDFLMQMSLKNVE